MRKVILTGLILISVQFLTAQISAVTETGDEVILYEDGTWKYLNDSIIENAEIPVNEKEFLKSKKSTFLVKSKKLNVGIWINPKNWSFTKGIENDAFEYQFRKKGDDLYAMLISEKMQIPIETLKGVDTTTTPEVHYSSDEMLVMSVVHESDGGKMVVLAFVTFKDGKAIEMISAKGDPA